MPAPDLHLYLDVPEPCWQPALDFWPAATGCRPSAARGEQGQFVSLLPRTGRSWVVLQRISSGDAGAHVDLQVPDPGHGLRQACAAGATPAWTFEDVEVLRSPGGQPFCLGRQADEPGRLERGEADGVLDQVCLDIPPRWWDDELAFWAAVTGRDLERRPGSEFAYLRARDDEVGQPRILLQRLGDDEPTVRAHADLAVSDRPATTRRHVAMGAREVEVFAWWTVLRAPSGHLYCLTDRDVLTGRAPSS